MGIFKRSGADPGSRNFCGKLTLSDRDDHVFLQSVNAGRRWHGKYGFASRGEQIIGGYPKTITFFSIPGI